MHNTELGCFRYSIFQSSSANQSISNSPSTSSCCCRRLSYSSAFISPRRGTRAKRRKASGEPRAILLARERNGRDRRTPYSSFHRQIPRRLERERRFDKIEPRDRSAERDGTEKRGRKDGRFEKIGERPRGERGKLL